MKDIVETILATHREIARKIAADVNAQFHISARGWTVEEAAEAGAVAAFARIRAALTAREPAELKPARDWAATWKRVARKLFGDREFWERDMVPRLVTDRASRTTGPKVPMEPSPTSPPVPTPGARTMTEPTRTLLTLLDQEAHQREASAVLCDNIGDETAKLNHLAQRDRLRAAVSRLRDEMRAAFNHSDGRLLLLTRINGGPCNP